MSKKPAATLKIVKLTPPAPAPAPAPERKPTLTADEIAVLEFIERGWYKCLNENFADNYCCFFLNHGLIDFTGGKTPDGRDDVKISDTGLIVLDLLDPNRTSKQAPAAQTDTVAYTVIHTISTGK